MVTLITQIYTYKVIFWFSESIDNAKGIKIFKLWSMLIKKKLHISVKLQQIFLICKCYNGDYNYLEVLGQPMQFFGVHALNLALVVINKKIIY